MHAALDAVEIVMRHGCCDSCKSPKDCCCYNRGGVTPQELMLQGGVPRQLRISAANPHGLPLPHPLVGHTTLGSHTPVPDPPEPDGRDAVLNATRCELVAMSPAFCVASSFS